MHPVLFVYWPLKITNQIHAKTKSELKNGQKVLRLALELLEEVLRLALELLLLFASILKPTQGLRILRYSGFSVFSGPCYSSNCRHQTLNWKCPSLLGPFGALNTFDV